MATGGAGTQAIASACRGPSVSSHDRHRSRSRAKSGCPILSPAKGGSLCKHLSCPLFSAQCRRP